MEDLVARLEIEHQILETLKANWDATMDLILQWKKIFLTKYGLIPGPQHTIRR